MTIGLFAPLPLAIMIPFMAAQSAAIGQAFGTHFQYAKRKISSMSNEEFNKLTPTQLVEDLTADIRGMIPSVTRSFDDMEKLQTIIIDSLLDSVRNLPSDIISSLSKAPDTPSVSPSVAGFTGGLPGIDSGIGNLLQAIANGIGQAFQFQPSTNPAAQFASVIKDAKAENKANQPSNAELVKEVQQTNIDTFQKQLQGESAAQKTLRAKIEGELQRRGLWLVYLSKLGFNPAQAKKANYRAFLNGHTAATSLYNKLAAQYNTTYKNIYPKLPFYKGP